MELFFDLIFAAAVAQVGAPLSTDYTPAGLLRYVFLFVLIWLAWSGHTLYCTRFDTDDLVQRLLVLVQSFVVAVMAANAKEALNSTASAGFGAAYAVMRLILAGQYFRARRVRETRELTTRFSAGYAIAALFWIGSALSPAPARYGLWAVALAIDLTTPWLARHCSLRNPPHAAHYPERVGLFTIILLGEFVAAVMRGIESQEYWSLAAASTAFASMTFGFAVWWWYFDGAQSAEIRHVRTKRQARLFRVWLWAHLPLSAAIGIAGVGFHRAISVRPGAALPAGDSAILCTAAGLVMLALIALGTTMEHHRPRVGVQLALVIVVFILALLSPRIPAAVLVIGLSLAAGIQAVLSHRRIPVAHEIAAAAA
jgi:low temperature requirement protein LtrA